MLKGRREFGYGDHRVHKAFLGAELGAASLKYPSHGTTWIVAVALMCAACFAIPATAQAETRSLTLYNTHTSEKQTITFKRNGRYIQSGLRDLNRFVRDWRRNESTEMDPRLFDLLWEVYREVGARQPVYVVSGYRSPATNDMLRSRSRGVAKNSRHTRGQALDFYIPGVPADKIRRTAMLKQVGGVGYYPRSRSPFVHLDTGNVRHWPRMSRNQLATVFPDGKTLHLPTDGKPLKGYQAALAEQQRGTLAKLNDGVSSRTTRTASASSGARSGGNVPGGRLLANLFNPNEESDNESGVGGDNPARDTAPRSRIVASAPTPPASVGNSSDASNSSLPGVAAAIPGASAEPLSGPTDPTPVPAPETRTATIDVVPKARPQEIIALAERLAAEEAAATQLAEADGQQEQPGELPFQVASEETQQALASSNPDETAVGGLDQSTVIAAARRQQEADEQAAAATETQIAEAVAVPRGRPTQAPAEQTQLAANTTPASVSGTSPAAVAFGATNSPFDGDAQQALALQLQTLAGSSLSSDVGQSDLRTNLEQGAGTQVLAFASQEPGLPPIPTPAVAIDALPDPSLTLPVLDTVGEKVSAEEIASIFAGTHPDQLAAAARQQQAALEPMVLPDLAPAQDAVSALEPRQASSAVFTAFETASLAYVGRLVHPDQSSLQPLLEPSVARRAASFRPIHARRLNDGEFRLRHVDLVATSD